MAGPTNRETINDTLQETHDLLGGNLVWFDEQWLKSNEIEQAAIDKLLELNAIDEKKRTDEETELRDDLITNLETLSSARETARRGGQNPNAWVMDNPLQTEPALRERNRHLIGPNGDIVGGPEARTPSATTEVIIADDTAAKEITELPDVAPDIEAGEGVGSRVVRIAYQCFLLYNMKYFSGLHKKLLKGGGNGAYVPTAGTDHQISTPGYYSNKHSSPRIHLVGENNSASSLMNRLHLRPGHTDFINIPTALYSQLMPMLRIYKVYRNHKGGGTDQAVEMAFENRTSLRGITDQLTASKPVGDGTYSTFSRGTACGVKSFDWTFLGTDPFTATRDIKATLKLTFQHFSELTKAREGLGQTAPDSNAMVPYRYIDLLVQPDCRRTGTQPTATGYFPPCYEIRVEVGYQDPGANSGFPADLIDAIRCQRQDLRLIMTDHQFDINKDGTFDLTITYRGRLGAIMSDKKFNVLIPSGGFADIEFDDPKEDGTARKSWLQTEIETPLTDELDLPADDQDKSRIKDLKFRRRRFYVKHKKEFHNRILKSLADNKMIHRIKLTPDQFDDFARWETDELRNTLPTPLGGARPVSTASTGEAPPSVDAEETNDREEDPGTALTEAVDLDTFQNRLSNKVRDEGYIIDYVFFGDLVASLTDHVLGEFGLAADTKQVRVGYSPGHSVTTGGGTKMVGGSPGTLQQQKVAPTGAVTDAAYKTIIKNFRLVLGTIEGTLPHEADKLILNIAHIPISIEMFHQFMVDKVLGPDRMYYSYFQMLDDLLSDVVTDLLGSQCFGGLFDAGAVRATTGLIESDGEIEDRMLTFNANTNPADDFETLKLENIDEKHPAFGKCNTDSSNKANSYQYLVLYASNLMDSDLAGDLNGDQGRGDEVGDKSRGILHTGFGYDRGLFKEAQFRKTDQEYLPEARFASEGDNIFNQLANVYDATFSMLGTSMFKPGQYIYFNPEALGAGQPWERKTDAGATPPTVTDQSWSNLMGLGGYHLITEVASSIKPGSYNTTLKARWVTSGKNNSE